MSSNPLTTVFMFLAIWGASFLFGVFLLNVLFFNMDRSRIKIVLKVGDLIVCVFLTPLLLIVFRNVPWVAEVLNLRPSSPMAQAFLTGLGAFWGITLVAQASFSFRTIRKKPVAHLISNHTRIAPFTPSPDDWAVYRQGKGPTVLEAKPGARARPECNRRQSPIPHDSPIRHAIQSWPLNRLDKSYQLHVHEVVLEFPQLPPAFDGIRVLQLSDSHYSALLSPHWYTHVIEEAVKIPKDLIVITGDFTASDHLYQESVDLFAPLSAPMGIWAIRGNHDYYTEPDLMAWFLEHHNINLIANRRHDFVRQGQTFRLVGTEHPYQTVRDWEALVGDKKGETFCLALSHRPDNIVSLSRAGADFVLAGHTHGGQWRLPFIGPLFVPSLYGRRFDQGFRQVKRALLYTSRGFGGHTFPLRLNCPPEIALFTLRRAPTGR